jgi:tetratricopeptide (TPR) repeat protein
MAFDKEKIMRAAEKYLSQGKIPAAIKEYKQIVDNDPNDFTVLNLLGDLYARTASTDDAIDCFMRVAEHYRAEGFALKAIAMYKKIDRITPGTLEIAAKLAPLYQMQGLMVDARANYLIVADAYQKAGQTQKALDVLRKIADLDPQNTEIRLKLAEGYQREQCIPEAVEAYVEAGARLLDKSQHERALDAYSAALKLRPFDCPALSGMASTYISMGVPDDAADLLERAVADQPDDPELLSMLAHSYVEMENAQSAERATADLVAIEPSSYRRFLEVARLYLKQSNLDETMRVLSSIVEELFTNNEEEELVKILNEVLARNPEQIQALKLMARVYTWRRDSERLRLTLERLAESAQLADLVDEERQALTQLVRLSPNETRFTERLQELGGALEDLPPGVAAQTFSMLDEQVPSFSDLSLAPEQSGGQQPAQDVNQFDWNSEQAAPTWNAVPIQTTDPSASFADLNDSWFQPEEQTPLNAQPVSVNQESGFHEFEIEQIPSSSVSPQTGAHPGESRSAQLKQELDSVDFYIAQGYMDVAKSTLELLEKQYGAHPEIISRRQNAGLGAPVQTTPVTPASEFEFEITPERDWSQPQTQQPTHPPKQTAAPQIIDAGLAEIFDEFREAFEEEDTSRLESGDYETHYNLGLAYKDMDLLDEAIEEFQQAVSQVAPKDGTPRYLQCCNLLGHCFMQKGIHKIAVMWYKKGLEAPGHTEDEYQALRYDLGLAYEQMGDLDQAIEIFTEVYGVNVSYRNVAEKLQELHDMNAHQ